MMKYWLPLLALLIVQTAFSQEKQLAKTARFSVTLGSGWSHYIDNLDYGSKNLKKDFAGLAFRLMWEPEYRLSLGLESGLYTLFSKQSPANAPTVGDVSRRITPALLHLRMRMIHHFYLGTGFGLAFLTNTTRYVDQKIVTKTISLSNYQFSASYLHPLGKQLQIGAEAKLFDFGAYNDWMYTSQLFITYRF